MKLIPLTQGQFAMVDDEDYEVVGGQKWYAAKSNLTYYARARPKKRGPIVHMHRVIMGITDPKLFADHRDKNGLNNQRLNLRLATRSQNNANKKVIGKSKYMGVFYQPASTLRPWYSRINKNGVNTYLGSFATEVEAAQAYNKAAEVIHEGFANLNPV